MIRSARRALILLAFLDATSAAAAGADRVQRLTVPITDPARPIAVHASLFTGSLFLEAYEGDQVEIEIFSPDEPGTPERVGGMQVIPNTSFGLTVEERDNTVSIEGNYASKLGRLVVKVPRRASVSASVIQGGDITVRGIEGELEFYNTSGAITATDVTGSVVAHSTSGDIKVSFTSIQAGKSMSFVSFDGDVDVTFPGDLKADLRLSAGQGKIYTDFEFKLVPIENQPKPERSGKKFLVQLEQEVRARIEGGGPEMHFKTWNGDIYIRKRGR